MKRCGSYEDFKEVEKISNLVRERYVKFAYTPETEFVICNIKCEEYSFNNGILGCVFNNDPNITRCPDCRFRLAEVEKNKVSLYKLRELYDSESEW